MYEIVRMDDTNEAINSFIDVEFTTYGMENGVDVHYEDFLFVAKDDNGEIIGAITGHAYYNEVYVGDLIIGKNYRRDGLGSKLIKTVEDAFKGKGYDIMTLTTFGFQAPEFYKKLGFKVEFVREQANSKISKYFLSKKL